MNTQRWLALGALVAVVACLATMNIWLFPLLEGDEEPNPTPTAEGAVAEGDAADGEAEDDGTNSAPTATPEPTLDPAIAAIMDDLEMEATAVGLDPFITRAGDFSAADPANRVDGRAAIYQLSDQQRVLRLDPFSGTVFVFRNRRATALKVLVYDGQGFWLCHKRFSSGKVVHWPTSSSVSTDLLAHELTVLLMNGDPSRTGVAPAWRALPRAPESPPSSYAGTAGA